MIVMRFSLLTMPMHQHLKTWYYIHTQAGIGEFTDEFADGSPCIGNTISRMLKPPMGGGL